LVEPLDFWNFVSWCLISVSWSCLHGLIQLREDVWRSPLEMCSRLSRPRHSMIITLMFSWGPLCYSRKRAICMQSIESSICVVMSLTFVIFTVTGVRGIDSSASVSSCISARYLSYSISCARCCESISTWHTRRVMKHFRFKVENLWISATFSEIHIEPGKTTGLPKIIWDQRITAADIGNTNHLAWQRSSVWQYQQMMRSSSYHDQRDSAVFISNHDPSVHACFTLWTNRIRKIP
jgi:hypothetical protein